MTRRATWRVGARPPMVGCTSCVMTARFDESVIRDATQALKRGKMASTNRRQIELDKWSARITIADEIRN